MTRRISRGFLGVLAFFLLAAGSLSAEMIQDELYDYYLDLPEGFELEDYSEDGMSYLFSHPQSPVQLALKIYSGEEYKSSITTLETVLNKLNADGSIDEFKWTRQSCAIGNFTMQLGESVSGWAICAPLRKAWSTYIVLVCYAPSTSADGWNQFMMSTINSLCISAEDYNMPGPVISYAYPSSEKIPVQLQIDGKTIETKIGATDAEAADFIVEMEYSVLLLYANHRLWKEAWQRYYRLIYRDSFGRLTTAAGDIIDALYPAAEKENPENPGIAYAQKLLSWVQSFDYQRQNESQRQTDFTSLPAMLLGQGNDCDSRSLLVCTLLKAAGTEAFLLISPEYSHALAAAELNAPGQTFSLEGLDTEFLMGETTAKVTWGMIAQEQADRKKWIPVLLP